MATWEDGPEYAPLMRPDHFAEPAVAPLEMAPPVSQPAALAPKERPMFGNPPVPVAPLATLVPPLESPRDPTRPFEVASSPLTATALPADPTQPLGSGSGSVIGQSAWASAHWSPPPPPVNGPWGPPMGGPAGWPPPDQPINPSAGPPVAVNGFPVPGTPQWFAPPPYGAPPLPATVTAGRVFTAATPGVLICLAVGGLIYLLAPIMLVVSFALSNRINVARKEVRAAFLSGLGALAFAAVLGALFDNAAFSDWWGFVGGFALVICWILLIALLIVVHRDLRGRSRPRSPWG